MTSLLPILTAPIACIWAVVAVVRGKLFDWGILPSERYGLPVICVGNLAVGGTGKTPHVEYLLNLLHSNGYRVAMLSRGYGRKTRGYILADDSHTATDIGDEPFQIRQNCPYAVVAVAEKRVVGMRELLRLEQPPQVVVLDDAYQHRYVQAGFNVLLTEARRLYTADHLLPWGRLREPASAARRAQAIVVTKCRPGERPPLLVLPHQQLYYSEICYAGNYLFQSGPASQSRVYKGQHILLVAGIANPAPLRTYLESQGAAHVEVLAFPDHHCFTEADARRISRAWNDLSGRFSSHGETLMAVTTQKDATRLGGIFGVFSQTLQARFYVQPIAVRVSTAHSSQASFNQKLLEYVRTNQGNRCMD